MNRHNPAKRRLERLADSVPVTMSEDAALTRSLPGSSPVAAWVWSRAVTDYLQLSQNGHCLAMLSSPRICRTPGSRPRTPGKARRRAGAGRRADGNVRRTRPHRDRPPGAAAGRLQDPAGMGRPGPACARHRRDRSGRAHPPRCRNSRRALARGFRDFDSPDGENSQAYWAGRLQVVLEHFLQYVDEAGEAT